MQRILKTIDRVENFTLVWTILVLAGIGFIQVITRYVFNYSFSWYEEMGRYLGVFIAFLGAAIGVKRESHFTMDLVVNNLKKPWHQLLKAFTSILSALFFILITFYSLKITIRMHGYGTTSPTMLIPMYIVYMPILLFSVVISFRFIVKAVQFIKEINNADDNQKGLNLATDIKVQGGPRLETDMKSATESSLSTANRDGGAE